MSKLTDKAKIAKLAGMKGMEYAVALAAPNGARPVNLPLKRAQFRALIDGNDVTARVEIVDSGGSITLLSVTPSPSPVAPEAASANAG